MINDQHAYLYWKTNSSTLLGYPPGTLICGEYYSGGGFAGAPEQVHLFPLSQVPPGQLSPSQEDFPEPGSDLEYRIGGRTFSNYTYCRAERILTREESGTCHKK